MTKDNVIPVRLEDAHKKIFEQFKPFFGTSNGEVIRNLALRWIESNIANPNIIELDKLGAVNIIKKQNKNKEKK